MAETNSECQEVHLVGDGAEEDIRALAPELHRGRDEVVGRGLQDEGAGGGRAGEADLVDALAGGQGAARLDAVAYHDVNDAGGDDILDEVHENHDRRRGLLRRLDDDAVARREGRRDLPRGHQQKEVPWDDLAYHTERLLDAERECVFADLRRRS